MLPRVREVRKQDGRLRHHKALPRPGWRDDEQLDDEVLDNDQDGETAAMVAARQSSAIAQKAMEDALAASAVRTKTSGLGFL